jgi:hypothetical protein
MVSLVLAPFVFAASSAAWRFALDVPRQFAGEWTQNVSADAAAGKARAARAMMMRVSFRAMPLQRGRPQ